MTKRNLDNATMLITGGAGFIGSNFVHLMHQKHPNAKIINFDKLTYAGNLANLSTIDNNSNYCFIRGDICQHNDVNRVFENFDIDFIINFAAESHVDRSIHKCIPFIDTNITGTANLLDAAKNRWQSNRKEKLFVQISTDEVYGSLDDDEIFTESSPLAPKNPYSATKAAADMLVMSYINTHDFPAIITRCTNNYGKFQFPEKLIPLTIINILTDKKIPIYGDGRQIRDWIYVEDHCLGIESAIKNGEIGTVYNFGGESQTYNIDLVRQVCNLCDKLTGTANSQDLITHITDRPGHDRRYAMDITSTIHKLEWKPKHSLKAALHKTVSWYLQNKPWWNQILNNKYREYYARQYGQED